VTSEEASNLKRKIKIIADNLSEQSERLVDFKNKKQELLRNSMRI
jgi:hypothetical protein